MEPAAAVSVQLHAVTTGTAAVPYHQYKDSEQLPTDELVSDDDQLNDEGINNKCS